jgi:hypothetical protein
VYDCLKNMEDEFKLKSMDWKFSEEEKALLDKLGIPIPERTKIPRKSTERVKTIDLSKTNAKQVETCRCCGAVTTRYMKFVKRGDMEGYAIRFVDAQLYPVTATHEVDVIMCSKCKNLETFSKEELIEMVENLRKQVRKIRIT